MRTIKRAGVSNLARREFEGVREASGDWRGRLPVAGDWVELTVCGRVSGVGVDAAGTLTDLTLESGTELAAEDVVELRVGARPLPTEPGTVIEYETDNGEGLERSMLLADGDETWVATDGTQWWRSDWGGATFKVIGEDA